MFECTQEGCDRVFPSAPGLQMHVMRAHLQKGGRAQLDTPRSQCPECDKWVADTYLPTHMRKYHRPEGELVPVPMNHTKQKGSQLNPTFKVMPFVVLEDGNGGLWIAEKIR